MRIALIVIPASLLIGWLLSRHGERRRAQSFLETRFRFERLLSELSAGLIHVEASQLVEALERGLQQAAAFLNADRGTLDECLDGAPGVRVSWTAPGIDELPRLMENGQFPWTAETVRGGHVVRFSRTDELPEHAVTDRASYERVGTRAHISIPLHVGGPVLGALSFDFVRGARVWSDELVARLRLLSQAFASALARKQVELEAQRLRQDLAHVGRVSAMGELTASLAHELNQPLTAILSNAQAAQRLLAADAVDLDEIREILVDIVADDKRAGAVIHRLRGLLKKGDLEFGVVDLNEIAREVAWLVRNDTVTRSVSMSLELATDLPRVRGDRAQLQQVVLNLVLNGLEAMQEPHAEDRTLVIRTTRPGAAAVRLAVQDSGIGIDEANVDRLFQPLHTTKAEGLGMGLAIARTIVEAHGGRLGAANNVCGGATFHFTLPVNTEAEL